MTVPDENMYQTHHLPQQVTQVQKDVIKSFVHSKRVGSYLLGRTLGVGSFAKVKEGMHLTTGEKVAIKVIDKKRAKTDNYVRKNLRREGKLLQMIRHPHIVSLFEVMETDNSYYLVTELCRGGDLMEYISSKKRLPEDEVAKFIRQIITAVDYLHRLGIIHRDLKIENLLLDCNKNIKLIDFGLSNFIKVANLPDGVRAEEFCVTQCGSPAYAAPELLNHEKYGLQVDLWSIGVNMYAMLTGGLPFTVEPFNIKVLYAKMRDRQMNPIPDDISRDCRDLLKKFLNPDPTRRVTHSRGDVPSMVRIRSKGNKPIPRSPCPNKIKTSDLDADILSHMSENLGFRMGEVIKFVTCNTPSPGYVSEVTGQRFSPYSHQMLNLPHPLPDLGSQGLTSVATDATDTTLETTNSKKDSGIVAIKVIDKKRAKTDNYVRKNLRREGKLLQMIRHPHIVSLFEVMETDNSYYLVTELCRGGDLMEYISSKKRLPEDEVAKFIRQIITAVDYLHRLGIIHRDLKIENLLLDCNKNIKLIDFGLSNFIKVANLPDGVRAEEFCVTQCGSPAYAAPELLNHEKYGLQVDLWSIGVNMYAMLTGGLPFTVEPFNIKVLYAKMRDRQMNPIPDDISRDCRDLLKKFLNPDPTRRVTIAEAMCHPWLASGNKPIPRSPCPNKIKTSDLDADILSHMSEHLGFRMGEVIKFVTCNTPSPACATYHLYLSKLNLYRLDKKVNNEGDVLSVVKPVDDGRIMLHLQDMCQKSQGKDSLLQPSNVELTSPTPRLQSQGLTSVATDATDTTLETTNSKKDSGIVTDASRIENSDCKENQNPLTKFESTEFKTLAYPPDSPTHSDVSSSKDPTPRSYNIQNFTKHLVNDPTAKGNTGIGLIASRLIKQMDVGRDLIEKLTAKSKAVEGMFSKEEKLHPAQNENNGSKKSSPVWPKILIDHGVTTESPSPKQQSSIYSKFKIQIKAKEKSDENQFGDENANINTQPMTGRRYIQNNKLLSRRALIKTDDMNVMNKFQDSGHIYIINSDSCKQGVKPAPIISRNLPKQYLPFRSAQDRPRMSEIHPLHELKDFQKAKTSESMTLHGKNVLSVDLESSPASKRSVSPPSKTVIIRRKLAKRHRLGELTPPGSHVIQDLDLDKSTNIFVRDLLDRKYVSNGIPVHKFVCIIKFPKYSIKKAKKITSIINRNLIDHIPQHILT
ncbi:hypothetical protein Btru_048416 [Bulinus truncatus]|nr:hypothetical protein Btru_048416 [Bulinus truncatus]